MELQNHCAGGLVPNYDCGTARPERNEPLPPERKLNRIREINISQLDYGYIVRVGCKSIALDSPEKILFALKQYFRNPENTEHQFEKGTLKFEK